MTELSQPNVSGARLLQQAAQLIDGLEALPLQEALNRLNTLETTFNALLDRIDDYRQELLEEGIPDDPPE